MNKVQLIRYSIAFIMVILMIAMVIYMTYIPVPAGNMQPIMLILGTVVGIGAASTPVLFGDKDAETEKLKERIRHLEVTLKVNEARYEDLAISYNKVMEMLIDRHLVPDSPKLPPVLLRKGGQLG